ncbi:formate dehydrogenase accessory sulfurtransferase FdhD [Amphibiibacter pelophylacis]|uniref:Formate dehydrogenase accessory sulfurtransferase FdhD n=1 Tax=Amphibiibacter pelophylacis TaxID=1799477 RepID=A0ACC6P0K2_9BURK
MTALPEPLAPPGAQTFEVTVHRDGGVQAQSDWLAQEVPVALVFNGISHAVMLASPGDLADFALGFALTEGLLSDPSELYSVDIQPRPQGLELQLTVSAACEWRLRQRRRTLAGRTGCGLCGTDSLDQVIQSHAPLADGPCVTRRALCEGQRALRAHQRLQQITGAAHAAAWVGLDGEIRLVREDVGRHNALDKLLGALVSPPRLREPGQAGPRFDPADGLVCITSRASLEMVQKTAALGIATLAAVSAPTALAVERARALHLTLAGFVRGDDLVVYSQPQRILEGD